ncbi:MAG: putative porin [Proteiniphilum sp.]
MKEKLFIILFAWMIGLTAAFSQARIIMPDSSQITTNPDSLDLLPRQSSPLDHLIHDHGAEADSLQKMAQMTIWRIDTRTGNRLPAVSDTLLHNFQQTVLPDGQSVAMGFLAPLGAPMFSKIFFDREETETFVFNNAYSYYLKEPRDLLFVNTRIPYSRISYHRAGPKQTREERLDARLTSNFGKELNIGVDIDLINARGFYASQSVKHNNFTLFGNYISDRIEAHAFMNLGSLSNFENGGITDELFITNPQAIQQSFTSKDIPVKFTNTWNSVGNNRYFLSGRYNLGYREIAGDSLHQGQGHFVPVASIGFSSEFTQQHRRFLSYDTAYVDVEGVRMQRIDQFYKNRFYDEAVDDSIHFTSVKNSVSLSLREGFKEWVKFGLTAFLEYDLRNYSLRDSIGPGYRQYRESAVTVGGVLNKQQGDNLLFNLRADLGVLGANLGEFRAMGDVETGFDIAGRRTTLSAEAYIKNLRPKYLQDHYYSKYFKWDRDFGDIRRVYVGGKLHIPFTNTTLSAGVENLQNFIYFDQDKNIQQENASIQVLMARVEQNLRLGIFNWDNQVVYQTSSHQAVIPVPTLSLYSNMYLKTKIVNELTLQLGVDAHYHTSYFVPGYEPALLQFYNQQEKEIGNYPISTIYANMHLKQTRFFVMFYNAATKLIKPQEYFSLPGYPVNPFGLRIGLSVNLHN